VSKETFRKIAWATLIATLAVILWGAYVRASGSGAGCGSHWPLCNGEVVPRPKSIKTVIEFTHRITSGVALVMTVVQLIGAFLAFPARRGVRAAAAFSMFFMLTEAAVGAGLVLFEMVAENKSIARAYWMSAHLTNTFFLIASMALTVWFAYDKPVPRLRGPRLLVVTPLGLGILLVGVAGAIVALGDTLFPSKTLAEGFAADLTPTAHFLIRLRAIHPVLAVFVGFSVLMVSRAIVPREKDPNVHRWALLTNLAFGAQVAIGVLNLVLLAPIALQLIHLLFADLYWMAAVIFGATLLASDQATARDPATSNRSASVSASTGQ
jgi:heme A synthase